MKKYCLILPLFLSSCSFFHTRADLEKAEPIPVAATDRHYVFPIKDLEKVTLAFKDALKREGYVVQSEEAPGKLIANAESEDFMGRANFHFNGGSNYKIAELTRVTIELQPSTAGVTSNMNIERVERFSMGQETAEEIKDGNLYRAILTKVQRGL